MEDILFILETDLRQLDGYAPQSFKLLKKVTTLGRGSQTVDVDVLISAKKEGKEIISRRHAEIICASDGIVTVRDLGALNGIFVNQKRIDTCVLHDNDIVQFGGVAKVPVGTTLVVSDICLKYRFRCTKSPEISPNTRNTGDRSRGNGVSADDYKDGTKRRLDNSISNITRPPLSNQSEKNEREMIEKIDEMKVQLESASACVSVQKEELEKLKTEKSKLLRKLRKRRRQDKNRSQLTTNNNGAKKRCVAGPFDSTNSNLIGSISSCAIDASALRSNLNCSLCGKLLLDAVVARCSHGFCWMCIERFVRQRSDAAGGKGSGASATCPLCRDEGFAGGSGE